MNIAGKGAEKGLKSIILDCMMKTKNVLVETGQDIFI